ncbi:transglutaminase-like domain-containing protein [Gimesia chilikensis]|uniref:Transglutaminase-like superfamily protein n=1 Tax=Gimesia chilikensis TaxID=2605989 RepID=A0A517PPZ2_9PLAN|nr:transglutaminase-like domain-containing protein [Gimesia chilikensis]QDT21436.1 Transglutaminase-like superfamily protein [Gimesia chilikensis]
MQAERTKSVESRILHYVSIAMVLTGALALCISDSHGRYSRTWIVVNTLIEVAVAFLGARYFLALKKRGGTESTVNLILLAVMLLSLAWEPVQRISFGTGRPFELILMFAVKNTMLVMAAAGCWGKYQRFATWGSIFLMICATTTYSGPDMIALAGLELVLGFFWLFYSHWNSLRIALLPAVKKQNLSKYLLLSAMAVLLFLIVSFSGENPIVHAFKGIIPSSGGDSRGDLHARDGLGDGELLVAGKYDIRSFAPIENAPFMSSDDPSLYDIMSDTYDEPGEISKNIDRAIGLKMQDQKIEEKELPDAENINRHFSTARNQKPAVEKSSAGISSDALLHVSGRTPLHLRMETYDIFDGVNWFSEPLKTDFKKSITLKERFEKPWIVVNGKAHTLSQECRNELHVITNNHLKSNQLPAPLHLREIHIDLVDRIDLFGWYQDSIVKLERKELPRLVPMHLISHFPDQKQIQYRDARFAALSHQQKHYIALPEVPLIPKIRGLANQLVADMDNDWDRIKKIEQYHREHFEQDRSVAFDGKQQLPLDEFLFESKVGPDYLIASSAALMLRSLGYSTRLVSGFYASPDDYDLKSDHTPVCADDVHFWVEVKVGPGPDDWCTIEPTAGYAVLGPPLSLYERTVEAILVATYWIGNHFVFCCSALGSIIGACLFRYQISACLITGWLRLYRPRDTRRLIFRTLWLLELRIRGQGQKRPLTMSLNQWFRQQAEHLSVNANCLAELAYYVNWAAFAPSTADHTQIPGGERISDCCNRIINEARWVKRTP